MSKGCILIVDDEPEVCEVLADRLNFCGYQTHSVHDGEAALRYVQKHVVDLILLDLMMPGMSGYEVAERLLLRPTEAPIPIIMLTAKASQQDKVKALTMGIDDYITKPYDSNELQARIAAILKRSRQARPGVQDTALAPEDASRMGVLQTMASRRLEKIFPHYRLDSASGYAYPDLEEVFAQSAGEELPVLQWLSRQRYLNEEFFDTVLVCTFCRGYNLNIRETCPECKSPNLRIVEEILHSSCGHRGRKDEFVEGIRYVCPQCHEELTRLGSDYEQPGESYFCESCRKGSAKPDVTAQCRSCLHSFDWSQAIRQRVDAYVLNRRGAEAAARGAFDNPEAAWMDGETSVYNVSYLRRKIHEERERSEQFSRSFSLLFCKMENFSELLKSQGEEAARRKLNEVALVFRESLQKVDVPARYDQNSFVALLPETDKKSAEARIESLRQRLQGLSQVRGSFRVSTYPEDHREENQLIHSLFH